MFEFVKGFVAKKDPEYVVLDVGGVGFRLNTSYSSYCKTEVGEEALFYTYLSVKEDDLSLFGFADEDELNAFKLLITVSGVGPKMALAVLSQMSVADFSLAVAGGNHKAISQAKGVGPKLAQRIILELKDKIAKAGFGQEENVSANDAAKASFFGDNSVFDEAVEALMFLGNNLAQARAKVGSVYEAGMTTEEVVKKAIKL